MKIDKVIWASSVEYSDFWNIISMIHHKFLGLDCVLLLYGNKNECNVSEEHGEVIEVPFLPSLPQIPQLVFNKWYYTKNEPDTTWMIGDIDQIPLQREHFVDTIADVPDDHYVHLADDAGTQLGFDFLVGHYHVGKGSTISKALNLDTPFETHVENLINQAKESKRPVWADEEPYTTQLIKRNYGDRFTGVSRVHDRKICRSSGCTFDKTLKGYYVDIHCPRPYTQNEAQIKDILSFFWGAL